MIHCIPRTAFHASHLTHHTPYTTFPCRNSHGIHAVQAPPFRPVLPVGSDACCPIKYAGALQKVCFTHKSLSGIYGGRYDLFQESVASWLTRPIQVLDAEKWLSEWPKSKKIWCVVDYVTLRQKRFSTKRKNCQKHGVSSDYPQCLGSPLFVSF